MSNDSWEPSERDILITRVRRGELTPAQAEAEAARQGFGPIATKPSRAEFDPDEMPWWSLPMALAWIAWRTTEQVQESCAEYRENWLEWFPGSWNVPTEDGQGFDRIDGYELRALGGSSSVRLSFEERYMRATGTLPDTTELTISEAEKELFSALAAGALIAVAKDKQANIVDIPQREWPYLQLFEEGEQDVLKQDALSQASFTAIKLKRDDLKRIWPEWLIEAHMIEPMVRPGTAGYVPLSSALHWIITEGGRNKRHLKDSASWSENVSRLLPLISTGEIEIVGRPRAGGPAEPIKGHTFLGIKVPTPLCVSFDILTGNEPWISCTTYVDEPHWADFNDQVFLGQSGPAAWTHLSVRKADVLRHFQFEGTARANATYETGAPGRPTSIQLVRAELQSRHRKGVAAATITQEAAALSEWLGKAHPQAPQLTAKTIKNQLGGEFRELHAQK